MTGEIKTTDELWEEIKSLSFGEVIIRNGLAVQEVGEFSREYIAMAMVVALQSALKITRDKYVNHLNKCSSPYIEVGA